MYASARSKKCFYAIVIQLDPTFGDFSKVWTTVFGEGGGWATSTAAHPFYLGGSKIKIERLSRLVHV